MIVNRQRTIVAGTPVAIEVDPCQVRSCFVQMKHGGTSIGYLLNLAFFPAGTVPDATNAQHVAAEMNAASATGAGGSWSYPDSDAGYDVSKMYLDGAHSGDVVIVSYDKKV